MMVEGWSGGYMGEGMGMEGTWVRVGGGGYTGEGRGWGGGGTSSTHSTHQCRGPKEIFYHFFISLRQSGWF